jgi:hypothetical protein
LWVAGPSSPASATLGELGIWRRFSPSGSPRVGLIATLPGRLVHHCVERAGRLGGAQQVTMAQPRCGSAMVIAPPESVPYGCTPMIVIAILNRSSTGLQELQ